MPTTEATHPVYKSEIVLPRNRLPSKERMPPTVSRQNHYGMQCPSKGANKPALASVKCMTPSS